MHFVRSITTIRPTQFFSVQSFEFIEIHFFVVFSNIFEFLFFLREFFLVEFHLIWKSG